MASVCLVPTRSAELTFVVDTEDGCPAGVNRFLFVSV